MSQSLVLGYWGVRGRGQVTRLICAHTGIKWQEKTYNSAEQWFGNDKQQLGILFPNLPYIIDGDIKVSQSDILPRYVIRKSGQLQLLGKNPRDMALVDNVIYAVMDLWTPIAELFVNKKWQDDKTSVFYKHKSKFAKLQKFINGKDTTIGYLTLADFVVSQFSYYVEKLFPEQYSKFKSLQNIRGTIQNLEGVKKYYESENCIQAVFLPPQITVFPFYLDKFNPKSPTHPVPKQKLSSSSPRKTPQVKKDVVINNGQKLKIVLMSGSLRKKSTNTGLLRACIQLNNPNLQFQWADISNIPMFDQDVEQQGVPQSVQKIKDQIRNSHGILFGVAQNNFSVSACMKNAYDWLSRGQDAPVIAMPAGMISSGGDKGGLRGQKAFKLIGQYCRINFMSKPEVCVQRYEGNFFDDQGNLIDQKTRQKLKGFLESFARWVDGNKLKK